MPAARHSRRAEDCQRGALRDNRGSEWVMQYKGKRGVWKLAGEISAFDKTETGFRTDNISLTVVGAGKQ